MKLIRSDEEELLQTASCGHLLALLTYLGARASEYLISSSYVKHYNSCLQTFFLFVLNQKSHFSLYVKTISLRQITKSPACLMHVQIKFDVVTRLNSDESLIEMSNYKSQMLEADKKVVRQLISCPCWLEWSWHISCSCPGTIVA